MDDRKILLGLLSAGLIGFGSYFLQGDRSKTTSFRSGSTKIERTFDQVSITASEEDGRKINPNLESIVKILKVLNKEIKDKNAQSCKEGRYLLDRSKSLEAIPLLQKCELGDRAYLADAYCKTGQIFDALMTFKENREYTQYWGLLNLIYDKITATTEDKDRLREDMAGSFNTLIKETLKRKGIESNRSDKDILKESLTVYSVIDGYDRETSCNIESSLFGDSSDTGELESVGDYVHIAGIYLKRGDRDRAVRILQENAENIGKELAYGIIGKIEIGEGNYDTARDYFERADQIVGIGHVLVKEGKIDAANQLYLENNLFGALADLEISLGNYDTAADYLLRARGEEDIETVSFRVTKANLCRKLNTYTSRERMACERD